MLKNFFVEKQEKKYKVLDVEHTEIEYRPHWGRIIGCGVGLLVAAGLSLSSFTVVGAGHHLWAGKRRRAAGGFSL